ncbi:ATP synthase subunit O, mitochondrial-like [Stegodyphus dumicola]|uniref:ATP synthase subunit O, mitochondrial-like n=1 Tax=Stegodyphus dumicola TaxID=202533 RepID=UPI0015AC4554|nr:ATP synthase subunit O, mitochondrial-like [Stegodyphus dumicola]
MNPSKNMLIFVRQLSTTPLRQAAMIKPPVPVFGVEGRYATALYSAAMKEKKLDAVEKDIKDLKVLLKQDVKFAEFVMNPLLKVNVKKDALAKIFSKKNYTPLTLNLLVALAENGRLKTLLPIIDCFNGVMSSIRGEVLCRIVSAKVNINYFYEILSYFGVRFQY